MSGNVQTENSNVTVTPEAEAEIKRVLQEDQYVGKAVRITVAGFGCGGFCPRSALSVSGIIWPIRALSVR